MLESRAPLLQVWLHMASMRMLLPTWASYSSLAAAQTHAGWQVSLCPMHVASRPLVGLPLTPAATTLHWALYF